MKKQAKNLKEGEKIRIADKTFNIIKLETSDIGKHGKRKVRLELLPEQGEKLVIIRPEDYPFETL
tara:strand:- start:228 stop:422 length:195 start_codon:yes stop_codon:yes gene_type:complete